LRLLIPCPPAIPTETENPTPVQTFTDQEWRAGTPCQNPIPEHTLSPLFYSPV
jgi:hypothetical protein